MPGSPLGGVALLSALPQDVLCRICYYDIFSFVQYHGSSTGIDLGVVRHHVLVQRYLAWTQVCKLFSAVVRSTVTNHVYGKIVELDIKGCLSYAIHDLERVLLECPAVEAVRVSANTFQYGDAAVAHSWRPPLADRKLTVLFTDIDPSMPFDAQLGWLAVVIECFHPVLQEVVIPSDFNHFGLPVSVFDDVQSKQLAQRAPVVPLRFQDCLLEPRPWGDENDVQAPLVAYLFPYLLAMHHPVTLQNCWSLRVMLGAGDPAYQEYRRRGGSEPWTEWRDNESLSGAFGEHDKVSLYHLLEEVELQQLASLQVHVLPSDWDQTSG
eukprot:EG_transcript_18721